MARGPDPKIDEIEILHQFVVSPEPAFIAKEIAEALDVTSNGARHRMEKLVDKGYLAKKKPSERTTLYWITAEGRRHYSENAG